MIRRWTFIGGLVVLFTFLTASISQAENARRIAFFSAATGPNYLADAFKMGLQDAGYIEGRNLTIEYRWMGGREKDYHDIASELAQLKVDVIVTAGHPAALAAKSATSLIPIVALAIMDPVGSGLAESLSRPGGNVTGFSLESTPQTNAKMIQLLREAISGLTRVGVLIQPTPGAAFTLTPYVKQRNRLGLFSKSMMYVAPKTSI